MQPPYPNRVLLIGGSARAATFSAERAGIRVIAIDRYGDADLRAACEQWIPFPQPSEMEETIRNLPSVPIIPLGGSENWIGTLEKCTTSPLFAGASCAQWEQAKSIEFLRNVAVEAKIRFPETRSTMPRRRDGLWLAKSPNSFGGLAVKWATEQPEEKTDSATDASTWIYQRKIPGKPLGASYFSCQGKTVLRGVCKGLTRPTAAHPFLYAGSCGPLTLTDSCAKLLCRVGNLIADSLKLSGLFNVDFIYNPVDGLHLLEINPRYSASMELLEGKQSRPTLIEAHLAAFVGSKVMLPDPITESRCKRIFFSHRPLKFYPQKLPKCAANQYWCDLPVSGSQIAAGNPILTSIGSGPTLAQAYRAAGSHPVSLR